MLFSALILLASWQPANIDSEASFNQLAQLLWLTPSLEVLDISYNNLNKIPSSFAHALVSLAKLRTLNLNRNTIGNAFLQSIMSSNQSTWGLKELYLGGCRLGGTSECSSGLDSPCTSLIGLSCGHPKTDTEASLDLLSPFSQRTPSLELLDIGHNNLETLPASFISTLVFHPRLRYLSLSWKSHLACSPGLSSACAINRLLSQLCIAASSAPLTLRDLSLFDLNMTAKCCGLMLEQVLALGSKGLQILRLFGRPSLSSYRTVLCRIISNHNFKIQEFNPNRLSNWRPAYDEAATDTLDSALKRNNRLARETQEAASGVLTVGRIVLLGSTGPLRPSPLLAVRFRLLDLPSELVQLVLSFIYPGALLDRQFSSVVRHATDRTTLLPRVVRLPFQEKVEFLEQAGCHCYD